MSGGGGDLDNSTNAVLNNSSGTEIATLTNPVRIDPTGTTTQPVSGTLTSTPSDGSKATYSAAIVGIVAALLPTDIFTLTGSATKTVRILRIWVSGTESTAAVRDILFIKRSAANTSGTSTNPTRVPYDSTNAAATATVNAYTANPTVGATAGTLISYKMTLVAANINAPISAVPIDFGNRPGQAVVLRGTSEVFAVNLNATTSTGSSFDIAIEWTEE